MTLNTESQYKTLCWLTKIAALLALMVVMLGAFTRLTDAGLGCPDWPGCYGQLVLPSQPNTLIQVQQQFPQQPIETKKAWTEMIHRYAAGTLGLLIVWIAGSLLWRRALWVLPLTLIGLLSFQAALGMWTVTLKLLPVVVMGHLLGGIFIFTCLVYLAWQLSSVQGSHLPQWRPWLTLGMIIVVMQIALGGWVSSNYAGLACVGFPQCNGQWLPPLALTRAFHFWSGIGHNYQGGLLETEVRATIQMVHRLGAWLTLFYILMLTSLIVIRVRLKPLRWLAVLSMLVVVIQFLLGIINVIYLLPLWSAVIHNGVAAVLLALVASMRYLTTQGVRHAG